MIDEGDVIETTAKANKALVDAIVAARKRPNFDLKTAVEEAKEAWMAELPLLTDRTSAALYISCIAVGLKMRVLNPQEAKAMMFIAQTHLTAIKEPEDKRAQRFAKIYGVAAPRRKRRAA